VADSLNHVIYSAKRKVKRKALRVKEKVSLAKRKVSPFPIFFLIDDILPVSYNYNQGGEVYDK